MSDIKVFSTKPHFDDFDAKNNFQRILFRPEIPVQVRELNQLQTILQNQIAAGSRYSIRNGERINGGQTRIVRKLPFVKLQGLADTPKAYVGATISRVSNGVKYLTANVVAIIASTATDPNTFYIQYTNTDEITGATTFTDNQTLLIEKTNGTFENVVTVTEDAVGNAQGFSVDEGIYFLNGQFVYVPKQFTVINKYSTEDLGREISVGFSLYESVVTPEEDPSLYDNAFGTPNESAPGAYRYRLQALLVTKTDDELASSEFVISQNEAAIPSEDIDVKNYFELAVIRFGSVQPRPRLDSDTTILEQTLARRTYDEEGDFVVDEFKMRLQEHLNTREFKIGTFSQVGRTVTISILQHGLSAGDAVRISLKDNSDNILLQGNYVVSNLPISSPENLFEIQVQQSVDRQGIAEAEFGLNGGLYAAADGGDEGKVGIILDRGKAYVRGYEIGTEGNTFIETTKARSTQVEANRIIQMQYASAFFVYSAGVLTNPKLGSFLELKDAASAVIGSAFVRGFKFDQTVTISGTVRNLYRLDFFDIKFNAGKDITLVSSVTSTINSFSATVVPSTVHIPFELDNNESALLFKAPYENIKTLSPKLYTRYFEVSDVTEVSGTSTIITFGAPSGEIFDDEPESFSVYINKSGGVYGIPQSVTLTNGGQTATINVTNIAGQNANGHPATIIAKTFKQTILVRTKTPTNRKQTLAAAATVVLDRADVFKLISITDSAGNDVTRQFELRTNATNAVYELSSVVLRPGNQLPTGNITINYNYFQHGSGDVFTVQSYTNQNIPYEEIPMHNGVSLADVVDFRQRKTSATQVEEVGAHYFINDEQFFCDTEFYLPRYDTVALAASGQFIVTNGISAIEPVVPGIPSDSILLYTMYLPAYTKNIKDIVFRASTLKRYGMKEIGQIVKRLEDVEQTASLSLLETRINSKNEFDKFRNGFFVDSFRSEYSADTESELNRISYNLSEGYIGPKAVISNVDLSISQNASGVKKHANGITTLNYDEVSYLQNNFASSTVRIQELLTSDYIGYLTLDPTTDIWTDTVNVNNYQFIDRVIDNRTAPNTSVRTDFVNSWTSTQDQLVSSTRGATTRRDGLGWTQIDTFNTTTILNRQAVTTVTQTIDVSSQNSTTQFVGTTTEVTPLTFIRERFIKFEGYGFKPNSRVYLKFDGVDLSKYTGPTQSTIGQPLVVSAAGFIQGVFRIPNESGSQILIPGIPGHENCPFIEHRTRYIGNPPGLRFLTGKRNVVLTDKPNNTEDYESTFGATVYTAEGNLRTNTDNFLTTRTTILSTTTRSTTSVSSTSQIVNTTSRTTVTQIDPLAQSFFVPGDGVSGAFITSVDVFFGPGINPSTNTDLATLEIRNMVNGYPGVEVPHNGIAVALPSAIIGSKDASVSTTFKFPSPVYLQSGTEYCFVVKSNSTKLSLWKSTLGEKQVLIGETTPNSGQIISKQPFLGSMFVSQNDTTWTAVQESDIKFNMKRAKFVTNGQLELVNQIKAENIGLRSDEHLTELDNNPFIMTAGSSTLYINNVGHGFKVGDKVKLSNKNITAANIQTVSINGIPATQLFTTTANNLQGLTITSIDTPEFGYIGVQVSAVASATGAFGGDEIFASRAIKYSSIELITDSIDVPASKISYKFRGRNYADNILSAYVDIQPQNKLDLNSPFVIQNYGDNSVSLLVQLTSSNDMVSPVFDEQRCTLITTGKIVNAIADTIDGNERGAAARYIQKKISTVNPSNTIDVFLDINAPAQSTVKLYFRTGQTDATGSWTELPVAPGYNLVTTEDPNRFQEIKFSTDSLGLLPEFFVSQIKIVMLSANEAKAPRVKNYRSIINSKI